MKPKKLLQFVHAMHHLGVARFTLGDLAVEFGGPAEDDDEPTVRTKRIGFQPPDHEDD